MRFTLIAAALAAIATPVVPATAQMVQGVDRDHRDIQRDGQRDGPRDGQRDAPPRSFREAKRDFQIQTRVAGPDRRQANRDWRQYRNYDYNRYERGQQTYYAERYYRDGRYYQPRRLTRNDRIYRGGNGQYYCRRNDGTTGLIIGGLAGGLLGNTLSNGRSSTLATLLGAGAGAALGSSIDRGNVRCR